MSKHDEWDYDNVEVHEPEREVMSVYSLRFTSQEIAEIRAAAKRESVTTSEFIRTAARTRAKTETVSAELLRAFSLAVADTCERYTAANVTGGKPLSVEALTRWLGEQSPMDAAADRELAARA